jgi:hypothetical protein
MEETEIQELVERLGRPHRTGGTVIERAAIVAEGADFDAVMAWILGRGGTAEVAPAKKPSGGLHGSRYHDGDQAPVPLRFILPPS